jgi:PAS domain S-box-containing protein
MRVLGESESPSQLFPAVLKLFCQELNWTFGALWRADYDRVVMRCAAIYEIEGTDSTAFRELTLARELYPGSGLPGAVWTERTAVWVEDLTKIENFPRQRFAAQAGFVSALAAPITSGSTVLGAFEFFSPGKREEEKEQLEFLAVAGKHLGIFLERIQAEEALTSSQAQFQLLAERALDPIVTIDEESTILFANSALLKLFGYSHKEIAGANLRILIPERLRARHDAGMQRYMDTGVRKLDWDAILLPALHRDGSEFNVNIRFGEFRRADKRLFSGYITRA